MSLRRGWRTGIAAVLVVTANRTIAADQGAQGVVVDIQGRVVVAASVTISCPSGVVRLRTDSRGEFATPRVDSTVCQLSISRPGFAEVTRPPGAWVSPMRIELQVAPIREHIDVTATASASLVDLASIGSAVVSADELETLGNRTADWLRYARMKAGATGGQGQVLLDGMPATALPPTAAIAQIAINVDPFSAEYMSPTENQINITTRGPDRRFHWSVGGASLGLGGQNPLLPDRPGTTRSANLVMTGGVPGLPLTFVAEVADNRQVQPVPLRASGAPEQPIGDLRAAETQTWTQSVTALFFLTTHAGLSLRGSYQQASTDARSGDVGGIVEPSAATGSTSIRREARLTFLQSVGGYRVRGGATILNSAQSSAGSMNAPMISVPGSLATGATALSSDAARRAWTAKGVVERLTDARAWSAGLTAGQSVDALDEHPNPFGTLLFPGLTDYARALEGAGTATRLTDTGNGLVRTTTVDAAGFLQGDLVKRGESRLRLGLRADYQNGDGVRASPRLSGAARMWGLNWSGSAGTFTKNWSDDLFTQVLVRGATQLVENVEDGIGLADAMNRSPAASVFADNSRSRTITAGIDRGFRRRRDAVLRASVQRQWGRWDSALEYTFTNATALPGMRRLPTALGWSDQLSSSFALQASQVHVRAQYVRQGGSLTAHYEWTRSRDSSSGPFATESAATPPLWAPSAEVSPHQASLVAYVRLPAALSISAIASARTGAPYDVAFARNAAGDYLFVDRAGLPRDSGIGPAFRSVDLYASKQIGLPPRLARWHGSRAIQVGVQGDDVFGWRNYLTLGAVVGTPLFGQPLSALPGRAFRFWVTL